MKISYSVFMTFCELRVNKIFVSQGGKTRFKLLSTDDGLHYLLLSTKTGRHDTPRAIQRVLDRFAETGFLTPARYIDICQNGSYILKLLDLYLKDSDPSKINRRY
jgi:hypothetical protein